MEPVDLSIRRQASSSPIHHPDNARLKHSESRDTVLTLACQSSPGQHRAFTGVNSQPAYMPDGTVSQC